MIKSNTTKTLKSQSIGTLIGTDNSKTNYIEDEVKKNKRSRLHNQATLQWLKTLHNIKKR